MMGFRRCGPGFLRVAWSLVGTRLRGAARGEGARPAARGVGQRRDPNAAWRSVWRNSRHRHIPASSPLNASDLSSAQSATRQDWKLHTAPPLRINSPPPLHQATSPIPTHLILSSSQTSFSTLFHTDDARTTMAPAQVDTPADGKCETRRAQAPGMGSMLRAPDRRRLPSDCTTILPYLRLWIFCCE